MMSNIVAVLSHPTQKYYQSKVLRITFNAPWYIRKNTLNNGSGIPLVKKEIIKLKGNYLKQLLKYPNEEPRHLFI